MRHLLLILALVMGLRDAFAVANRSVSGSQQFIVYCEDRSLRQNLAGAFDDVRKGLFSELSIPLGSSTPIYVNIAARKIVEYSAPASNMRWLDAPEGARVQLDILVDDEMKPASLQEKIISALLLTIKYRDKPPSGGTTYHDPPVWLVEGLSERIRQRTLEPNAALYRGLLNTKVPAIKEWMQIQPASLDATSLGIYRAYASSLVAFFQSETNGPEKLRDYLRMTTNQPEADIALLAKLFPSLGDNGKNIDKWWSLSLAKLSASDRYAAWTGPDTSKALQDLLTIKLTVGDETRNYTLDQFEEFIKHPELNSALTALNNDLVRLSIHTHPLYRPVISGFQEVTSRLKRRKTRNLAAKIQELNELRTNLDNRLLSVSDYLTWFQTTQTGPNHGEFASYFRLMQSYQAPRPRSSEPLGQYLDAMEAELKP